VLQPFVTRVDSADPASGSGMSTVLVCAPDLTRTRIAYAVSETGSETLSHATCPVRSNDCGRVPTAMCGKTPGEVRPGPVRPRGVTWLWFPGWPLTDSVAATDRLSGEVGRP